MLDCDQQRLTAALPLVRQRERDEAPIFTVDLAEHRPNMRRVAVDIRDHHNHVARAQGRVFAEPGQELVVQHFHFALGTVCDVETDRTVFQRIDCRPLFPSLIQRAQFENVVLPTGSTGWQVRLR